MSTTSRVAGAVAAGYALGRFKKLRLAVLVATAMSSPKIRAAAAGMLQDRLPGGAITGTITKEVGGRLVNVGKTAATSIVASRIDSLSQSLAERSENLRQTGKSRADESAAGNGSEEPTDEYEDQEGEEADEPTDEYEEDEEPSDEYEDQEGEEADEPTDEYEDDEAEEPSDEYEDQEGEEADEPTDEYEDEEAEEPTDEYEDQEGEEADEPTDEYEEPEAPQDEEPEEPVARSPRRRRSASPAGRGRG